VIRRIFQYASGKEARLLARTPQMRCRNLPSSRFKKRLRPKKGNRGARHQRTSLLPFFRVVYALTVANSGCLGLIQLVTHHCYDLAVLFRSSSL
jgi:hypothetical protein